MSDYSLDSNITPANVPESAVTKAIANDLEPQDVKLIELHIDRAYLNSHFVKKRPEDEHTQGKKRYHLPYSRASALSS